MSDARDDARAPSGARLASLAQSLSARGHAVWPDAFDPQECEALAGCAAVSGEPRRVALAAAWQDRIEAVRRGLAPLAAQWRQARSAPHPDDSLSVPPPDVWLTRTDASTDCPVVTSGDDDAGFGLLFIVLLNRAGVDFSGGELVLAEQRPRMQTRPHVVPLAQGGLAVIAAAGRPVQGARGPYRVLVRRGVARVCAGRRVAVMMGWPLPRHAV